MTGPPESFPTESPFLRNRRSASGVLGCVQAHLQLPPSWEILETALQWRFSSKGALGPSPAMGQSLLAARRVYAKDFCT